MLFKRSIVRSLSQSLSAIFIFSVLSTALALVTVVSSLSDAEAVNISGSLRMQSYRLAYDITTNAKELERHLNDYDMSLHAPALDHLNRFYVPDNVQEHYHALLNRWEVLHNEIVMGNHDFYLQEVANYVRQIDGFVLAIQRFSELKLWFSFAIGVLGFMAIVLVVVMTIRSAQQRIVIPLKEMVKASEDIQSGTFVTHLDTQSSNELGVLARAFTSMSAELEKLYRSLEMKVEEKTLMLREANNMLGILYDCSQAMNSPKIDERCFSEVLSILTGSDYFQSARLEIFNRGEEPWVISRGKPLEDTLWHSSKLVQKDNVLGQLVWQQRHDTVPEQLIQNVTHMLSRGVLFNQSQKQQVQLLLMEERATIARELHDSLAQSLAFLRIQLTILKRKLPSDNVAVRETIDEFDDALTGAYIQLRELLATFRLSIEEADLFEALTQMIKPLQSQTDSHIRLTCALPSHSLSAHHQVHALQIVREAVMNAIKHAQAENITINCESTPDGYNIFTVTDDGIGMKSFDEPDGHYGLNIMEERAKLLNGNIHFGHGDQGGTIVKLIFPHS